jgi:pantoate--beta-alanine ligase
MDEMKKFTTIQKMQNEAEMIHRGGFTIGFVPTMGYLHEGHLSLVRIARARADVVVVSIFVNPTQFGPDEDLDHYPRDLKRDEELLGKENVDIIFYPSTEEMYPEDFLTHVTVDGITQTLCGRSRSGHFRGVTTVCAKLFLAVKPDFAVFGQKDAQQTVVIQRMVRDLNMDLEIVVGPIVREKDGLALSSRNAYLSTEERQDALCLSESLNMARDMIRKGESDVFRLIQAMTKKIQSKKNTRIDYIQSVNSETLEDLERIENRALIALAVFVGKTRLIDNILVDLQEE